MRVGLLLASFVAAVSLVASPAFACKGKSDVFSADLSDEDSLTADGTDLTFNNDKVLVKVAKGRFGVAMYGEDISDAVDMCLTFKTIKEAGNDAAAGILFWDDGGSKYFAWVFTKTGQARVSFRDEKGWGKTPPLADKKVGYKKGQENTLRITLQGGNATVYVNDMKVGQFKRKGGAPDSFMVGIAFQEGDYEVSKFAGTSVD
jgi:hypothetical protein